MSLFKKDTTQKSREIYLDRLNKQGFLPKLSSEGSAELKDKIAGLDENVLPTPLPESGKPRGCWKQLFGQANQWRNTKVTAIDDASDHDNTSGSSVRPRR